MSESSAFYCELCGKENFNAYNLATHLASKAHREKVEAIVSDYTERLNASRSELAAVEQKISARSAEVEEAEERLSAQREEAEANDVVIKEQREQIQKNAEMLSAQTPELDALTAKVEPLRSEVLSLESKAEKLKTEESDAQKRLDEIVARIEEAVRLTPELEKVARNEVLEGLVREEEARFNADRLERVKNQRDYQIGAINVDEFIRRET